MKYLLFLSIPLLATGCIDNQYPYNSGSYGNGYYNDGYYGSSYNPPPPPPPPRDCRYYGTCDRDYDQHHNHHQRHQDYPPPPTFQPPPAQPSRPAPLEERPSCPAGSVLDGRGCRVTNPSMRKPGGDGYINPCHNGYYSGGRCVSR